jgi:hypothetical protein
VLSLFFNLNALRCGSVPPQLSGRVRGEKGI